MVYHFVTESARSNQSQIHNVIECKHKLAIESTKLMQANVSLKEPLNVHILDNIHVHRYWLLRRLRIGIRKCATRMAHPNRLGTIIIYRRGGGED